MHLRISVSDIDPRTNKKGKWCRFSVNFTRVTDDLPMGTNKGWTYSPSLGVRSPQSRMGASYYEFWDLDKQFREHVHNLLLSFPKVTEYFRTELTELPEIDVEGGEEFLDR